MKKSQYTAIAICVLLAINGLGAVAAGYGFIRYPDGSALGMNTFMLRYSPFIDFLIPGIVLFICNGLLSIMTLYFFVIGKSKAGLWLTIQGIVLTGWIAIQMIMLRDMNYMHGIFGAIGVVFIVYGCGLVKKKRSKKV